MFLLLLLSSLVQLIHCKQGFSEQPSYREVNPGEDAYLTCRIRDKSRNSQCIWQKDGKPIRLQVNEGNRSQSIIGFYERLRD